MRSICAIGVTAMMLAACADSATTPTEAAGAPDPVLVQVAAAGFDTVGAYRLGDKIVVEDDIVLSAGRIEQSRTIAVPGDPLFQYRTYATVGQAKTYGITLDLSGLASATWQTAARAAITEWNNVGNAGVYLIEASPGDITVILSNTFPSCSQAIVAAQAEFPQFDDPGDTIRINPNFGSSGCGTLTASGAKRTMAHEIGHAVGLRHTNWSGEGADPEGAVHIPGTPSGNTTSADPGSVMNRGFAGSAWNGWSNYDRIAIRTLYPKVASVVIQFQPQERVVGGTPFWVSHSAYTSTGAYIPGKTAQSWIVFNPAVASISPGGNLSGLQAGSTTLWAFVDGVVGQTSVQVVDISISGPDSLGTSQSATFSSSIVGPGGPYQPYYWSTGDDTYCLNQASCLLSGSQLDGGLTVVYRNQTTFNLLGKFKEVVVF